MKNYSKITFLALICCVSPTSSNACNELFEGFGVFLGSVDHFSYSRSKTVPRVLNKIYNDLGVRYFRTSYESTFSPSSDVYEIVCGSEPRICSWIDVHNEISRYQNTSFMASIWSPPWHMKNITFHTLPEDQEKNFHYFIGNITALIKTQFNITIESVSPVNEPENILAAWEHTYMSPQQLCRMVHDFNDSLISICPESSYFTTSLNFATLSTPTCLETCKIFGTHAYALKIVGGGLKAYYDLVRRDRTISSNIPIYQTEVCSTFDDAAVNQMGESLDMANNIVNFVGHTCIQRYYFWYSYTLNPSGESLIWGNSRGDLTFPKKYFVYRHFTLAAYGGSKLVNKYDPMTAVSILTFGDAKVVYVNNLSSAVTANWTDVVGCVSGTFFCTTDRNDWIWSGNGTTLPAKSVCSCDYIRTPTLLYSDS